MESFSLLEQNEIKCLIRYFKFKFVAHIVHASSAACSFDEPRAFISNARPPPSVSVLKNDLEAVYFLLCAPSNIIPREEMRNWNQCLAAAKSLEMQAEVYASRAEFLLKIRESDLAYLDTNRAYALYQPWESRLPRDLQLRLDRVRTNAIHELRERRDYRRMAVEYPFEEGKRLTASDEALKWSCKIQEPNQFQVDETVIEDFPNKIWTEYANQQSRLSPKVEFSYSEKYGWNWRAKEKIIAGETLSIEDYFALILSPENIHFYCSYCTKWFLALIPCKSCQTEMYCSESCRDEAYNSYHKTECKVLPFLSNLRNRDLALLVLRIFLTGTKQGEHLSKTQSSGQDPAYDLNLDEEVYNGMCKRSTREGSAFQNDYGTVMTLVWLGERANKGSLGLLQPAYLMNDMIEIFIGLRKINFFNLEVDSDDVNFENREKLAIVFLLHNAALISYNRSKVKANFFEKINEPPKTKTIGLGLRVCHSFLNHCCAPNAAVVRDRRHELVYAVRNMQAGEQIYISYVGDYGDTIFQDRRNELRREHRIIDCPCKTCGIEKEPSIWQEWGSEGIGNGYLDCLPEPEILFRIDTFHKMMEQYATDLTKISEKSLRNLLTFQLSSYRQLLIEPSVTSWLCEDLIKKFMQILLGNYRTISRQTTQPSLPQISIEL